MLNRRERILLVVVLAIAGSYTLFWLAKRTLLDPHNAQVTQKQRLQTEIAEKQKQLEKVFRARTQLDEWEQASLPSDPATALTLYQEFLFKLMQDCHIEEWAVAPGKPQRAKYFTRIPFIVSGKGTLENITELLYRFYEPKLLHQVRSLSIRRAKEAKGGPLELTMSVEGLALHSAPRRGELLPQGHETGGTVLAGAPREDFAILAQKNVFEPFHEPPEKRKEPTIEAAKHIYLTGATMVDEEPTAWLYNRLTNENKLLQPGDELDMAGVKGTVTGVSRSGITIEMNNKRWSLDLGKNLQEMRALAMELSESIEAAKPDATGEGPAAKPASDGGPGS